MGFAPIYLVVSRCMSKVTIDLLTETNGAASVKLYVAARKYNLTDLEWLVTKLNGYLDAIESGVLEKDYPEMQNDNVVIQIDVIGDPPDNLVNCILNNHNHVIGKKK